MKRSEKVAIQASAAGAVVAGAVFYFLPDFHWWAYAAIGVVAAAGAYERGLQMGAHEKIIDKDG